MKLTPLDVRHQEFSQAFRGCSRREVKAFLEHVADQLEEYERQQRAFVERVAELERMVVELRAGEEILRRTVVSAEQIASEMRANAEREAQLILQDGERAKERLLIEADGFLKEAEATKARARFEAEAILKDAEASKERLLNEAHGRVRELRGSLERVYGERALFVTQFRSLLHGYLASLERIDERHSDRIEEPIG